MSYYNADRTTVPHNEECKTVVIPGESIEMTSGAF